MKTEKKHGGARTGSGRPSLGGVTQKSVNLTDEQWEIARRLGAGCSRKGNSARGIRRALDTFDALIAAIDAMPASKVTCDNMLLVPIDRYNAVVRLLNGLGYSEGVR